MFHRASCDRGGTVCPSKKKCDAKLSEAGAFLETGDQRCGERMDTAGNAIVASVQTQRDQGLVVPINSREIASCRHRQNRAAARDTTFGRALAEQLCYIAEEYSLSRPCRAVPRVAGNYVPSRGRLRTEQWACSRVLRASSRLLEMDVLVNRRIVSLVPLPTVCSHEGFADMFGTSRAHPQCSTFMLD